MTKGMSESLPKLLWNFAFASAERQRYSYSALLLLASVSITTAAPILFGAIIDIFHADREAGGTAIGIVLVLAYCGARFGSTLVNYIRNRIYTKLLNAARLRFYTAMLDRIMILPSQIHIREKRGTLTETMFSGQRGFDQILYNIIFVFIPLMLEIFIALAVLLMFGHISIICIVVLIVALFTFVMVRSSQPLAKGESELVASFIAAGAVAVEVIGSYETLHYFDTTKSMAKRYGLALESSNNHFLGQILLRGRFHLLQSAILNGGMVAVLLTALHSVTSQTMTIGEFAMLNLYVLQLIAPLQHVNDIYMGTRSAISQIGALIQLVDSAPAIHDGARDLAPGVPSVEFAGIGLSYDGKRPILQNVSFRLPAGETLAIVGESGAGKSSIARLLLRLCDADTGRILIGETDLREYGVRSLRQSISIVPQDVHLLNDTILANVRLGMPDASEEDIRIALTEAGLDALIDRLPEGLATMVGDRGVALSGGERQRLGIARALLRDPLLLVFDEPTASLDSVTEESILHCLYRVAKNRTTVIISHRLKLCARADKIIVLSEGTIVEHGIHEELLHEGGHYSTLWAQQEPIVMPAEPDYA